MRAPGPQERGSGDFSKKPITSASQMTEISPLLPEALFNCCDPDQFHFQTTADLQELTEFVGQSRAQQAVHFGVGIRREGFNLYVMGPPGMGKHTLVRHFLDDKAATRPSSSDWVYVNNFNQPHKPRALRLPSGRGHRLRLDMEQLIDELATVLPSTFESEEYRTQMQAVEEELKEQQEHAFSELGEEAARHDIRLFRTPSGFAFAPMKGEEVVGPEEFEKWPKEEQKRIEQVVAQLQEKLQGIIQRIAQWRKESREKLRALNREFSRSAVGHLIEELKAQYADLPGVLHYLDEVEKDLVDNVRDFIRPKEGAEALPGVAGETDPRALHRYKVNVFIGNGERKGAPVVYLDHPTYLNLVGRAEHIAQMGTLVTDFTLLKPGALHEANGGYLMLDAHKLLTQPFAWEGLKRSLYAGEVRVESLEKMLSIVSTVALEPEAIPLDLKVVILGDRILYYLLHEYDPDFAELFKVSADFEEQVDRNEETNQVYARLIGTLIRKESLRHADRFAVARIIEHAARVVEDSERLTTHMRSVADVLREADYWAGEAGREVIAAEDIDKAIHQQVYRAARVQEHIYEAISRGTILIDTEGAKVGQINGLSVIELGDYSFGQPSRITATVHIGEGHVVDIEREVELGGAIHSKGVLILSSFLAARYATDHPLSLSASLVFEQSYGGVDGDSASLGELCALLSAIANTPIRQSLAITGSVNQHGQVQPIGGVNEKIEGFFQVCKARGLSGEHGVVIPVSNVKHLMLNSEVRRAAAEGKFHIYPVATVDEALSVLMGLPAGERDESGQWPEESLNGRVQVRLTEMSLIRQTFAESVKERLRDEGGEGDIELEGK